MAFGDGVPYECLGLDEGTSTGLPMASEEEEREGLSPPQFEDSDKMAVWEAGRVLTNSYLSCR